MQNRELKIATWNLDRPSSTSRKPKNDAITKALRDIDADILVLTETNTCIDLHDKYQTCFATTGLFESLSTGGERYERGENRVTIWSKFPGQRRIDMCNSHSSICALLKCNDWGDLNVYGTIIGIYDKDRTRWDTPAPIVPDFWTTIEAQLLDWKRLAGLGNLCIAGDFNTSLQGTYYVSTDGREKINTCFEKLKIEALTRDIPDNVDHIGISEAFLRGLNLKPTFKPWNETKNKKLFSDHKGICVTLERTSAVP